MPDADAEQEAARMVARELVVVAATSAGSCCQTLRMPVATRIVSPAST
jgi:hypothetical protein